MSSVMYRKEINVAESARDMGELFAGSAHDIQIEFLLGWTDSASRFGWPMQCRYITDDFPASRKAEAAAMLRTLADHLAEQTP